MRKARVLWIGVLAVLTWMVGPAPTQLGPNQAQASVSVALSLEELIDGSDLAVVAEAVERHSVWEKVEGSKRIVTYTKLKPLQAVYGAAGTAVWVRTLGGVVGKIGQHVSGEPQLPVGERCLLFLTRASDGVLVVTGRAQGHYPVHTTDKGRKLLRASPDRGHVIPRRGPSISAYTRLVGRELGAALDDVRKTYQQRNDHR